MTTIIKKGLENQAVNIADTNAIANTLQKDEKELQNDELNQQGQEHN